VTLGDKVGENVIVV